MRFHLTTTELVWMPVLWSIVFWGSYKPWLRYGLQQQPFCVEWIRLCWYYLDINTDMRLFTSYYGITTCVTFILTHKTNRLWINHNPAVFIHIRSESQTRLYFGASIKWQFSYTTRSSEGPIRCFGQQRARCMSGISQRMFCHPDFQADRTDSILVKEWTAPM